MSRNITATLSALAILASLSLSAPAQALPPSLTPPIANPLPGSAGGAGGVPFNGVTNLDPVHLPNFRLAIAQMQLGAGDALVKCIGDSTEAGVYTPGSTTAVYTNGRVGSTCADMATILNADGVPAIMDNWFADAGASTHSSSLSAYYPQVTEGSGWAPSTGVIVPGGNAEGNSTTTNNLATASRTAVDTAVIYYVTNGSLGTFTYQVDSGTVSSAVSESSAAGISTLTVSLGSAATHTLNIARASGSVFIAGVRFYNSTKRQIEFLNLGFGGSKTSDWLLATQGWSIGNQIGTATYGSSLTFINLGINDEIYSLGPSTTAANLTTLVSDLEAQNSDVVLIVPYPSSASETALATQLSYMTALRVLATTLNVGMLDWNLRVGSYAQAVAQGFGGAGDLVHPKQSAYADQAGWRVRMVGIAAGAW